jgi:glutathione S-transferase
MAAPRRLLHDLCGADPARRFSPYCWRAKLALAHKGLEVETLPWRFTDKAAIADSGQDKVPVLRDGDRVVADSWRIAEYLEDTYPDRPSLFGGPGGRALARFVNTWADAVQIPGIAGLVVADIVPHLGPEDRAYFVATRERRYGKPLAEVVAGREGRVAQFRQAMHPVRMVLRERPWLGGADGPAYADYIVFGGFQWARCVSAFPLLTPDDPLHGWRGRMLDLFGGLARRAPAEDRSDG